MPELQSTSTGSAPEAFAGLCEPEDFALGFECADPSLQIERWCDEAERCVAAGDAG